MHTSATALLSSNRPRILLLVRLTNEDVDSSSEACRAGTACYVKGYTRRFARTISDSFARIALMLDRDRVLD